MCLYTYIVFPRLGVPFFGVPRNRDYSILVVLLELPIFGNHHICDCHLFGAVTSSLRVKGVHSHRDQAG